MAGSILSNGMKRFIKIWWMMAGNATQQAFVSRLSASTLILGKLLRFWFFLFFLTIIGTKTKLIAGFTLQQMILFYLTFVFIDTLAQLLLREVYRFRNYIVSGDFDFFLVKPLPALFRSLLGGADVLDIPMTIISALAIIITVLHLDNISLTNIIFYILLIANAFLIAVSFHIFALSLGVVTTEIDNAIMLYRDLTQMGSVPIDIYKEPLRELITFAIPIGIMMTFPAKALLGILSLQFIVISVAIAIVFFWISISLWNIALRYYSSASS